MRTCNYCHKENADTSLFCIGCGKNLNERPVNSTPPTSAFFGSQVPQNDSPLSFTKPIENKPIQNSSFGKSTLSNAKKNPTIAIIAIVVILVIGVFGYNAYQENVKRQYAGNMNEATELMYSSANDAEDLMILTANVWYNAIWEVYDYETNDYTRSLWGYYDYDIALANLYADATTISKVYKLGSDLTTISSLIDKLGNPPGEYETDYQNLLACYYAYEDIINAASSPSGSYITYTAAKSTLISSFLLYYNRLP